MDANDLNLTGGPPGDGQTGGQGDAGGQGAGSTILGGDGAKPDDNGAGDGKPASWLDTFTDDTLKGHESLKAFDGPEALAKAYLEAQGKIPVPLENAEAYAIPKLEGYEADPEGEKWFRETAFGLGLTADQAEKLFTVGWQRAVAAAKTVEESRQKEAEGLMREWGGGDAARGNLAAALKPVNWIETQLPGFKEYLNQTGAGSDPMLIKAFHLIGKTIGEDHWEPGTPASGKREMERTEGGQPIFDFDKSPNMPKG